MAAQEDGFGCWMKQDDVCCGSPYIPCIFRYLYTHFPDSCLSALQYLLPRGVGPVLAKLEAKKSIQMQLFSLSLQSPTCLDMEGIFWNFRGAGWIQSVMDSGFPPSPIISGLAAEGSLCL